MAVMEAISAAAQEGPVVFTFGPFELHLERAVLLRDGVELPLRPKAFDVLVYLLRHAGRLVSREELLRAAWPGVFVTDDSLTQCVIEIRKALGDDERSVIRTVPRKGYLFGLPVKASLPPNAADPADTAVQLVSAGTLPHRAVLSRWPVFTITGLAIAVVVLAWWFFQSFKPLTQANETTFSPPPGSIAVLPFADLSPAGDHEYLADGISEEILNALTRIQGLTVIARTSSFAFKNSGSTIGDIARRLNVAYVLEGSVRMDGDAVRVTAQLVAGATAAHLWAQTFDLRLENVIELQTKVAQAVAARLAVYGLAGTQLQAVATGTKSYDVQAWDHMLRGRFFYSRRGDGDLQRALREFEQAVAIDPGLADAWAGRANALILLALLHVSGYAQDNPAIRAALERALALDKTNPEALIRMAQIEFLAGRYEQAWHYLDRAIRHGENSALVQGMLAGTALFALELERAVELQRRAVALDPLGAVNWSNLAHHLYIAGHFDEAESTTQRALELNPQADLSDRLFLIALYRQDYATARALASAMPQGSWRDMAWTMLHHLSGHPVESAQALARLQGYSGPDASMRLAVAHAFRGETEAAFQAIAATTEAVMAKERGDIEFDLLIELQTSPFLTPLRADPRWPGWVSESHRQLAGKWGWDLAEIFRRYPRLGRPAS
jgi:TolB-like protein/DNA-binding winged helix-turn-helix (wHTH) protein/Tfp pilus assembly protein PilF